MKLKIKLLIMSILLLNLIFKISSQTTSRTLLETCNDDVGNYTTNSTYQNNLNLLLDNLTNKANSSLFNNYTVGDGLDQAYGLYMCRGDFTAAQCQSCVNDASTTIIERCPVEKEAFMWYEDCFVRYANRSIFSIEAVDPGIYTNSDENVTSPLQFGQILVGIVNELIPQAAYNTSRRGFAFSQANISLFEDVYVLVQCTPDIIGGLCENCLRTALRNIGDCCGTLRLRTSMYLASCWVRYSNVPLVTEQQIPGLPPLSLPPSDGQSLTSNFFFSPPPSRSSPPGGSNAATKASGGISFMCGLMIVLSFIMAL